MLTFNTPNPRENMHCSVTIDLLKELSERPLLELISDAHAVHRKHHAVGEIQICHLISIKTGGCQEDCRYCAQSSRHQSDVKPEPVMSAPEILRRTREAVRWGVTRICLGAAWRQPREGKVFEDLLKTIEEIQSLGIEVCCTFGMLTESQAKRLKEAGVFAYNHNLDTSEEFYPHIVSTRHYKDRLDTLNRARKAGLSLCCGGIFGLGETLEDRLKLILTIAQMDPQPESVPLNRLTPIRGTPLENEPLFPEWELLRMIAITRIALPKTKIRLSSGRSEMSIPSQSLAFFAGANSIFIGDRLLTVANPSIDQDREMFATLGLRGCGA